MKKKKMHLYLPHELIIEILLRLPTKSLIRFKCVCKSWFSLISHPNFANSHFDLTAATHTPRILSIFYSPLEFQSIDFESSNDSASSGNLNKKFIPQSGDKEFRAYIEISCRGFIFFHCFSRLYLWNPCTGLHKLMPLSPFDSKFLTYCLRSNLYGFGYDKSRNDYLVVVLGSESNLASNVVLSHLEVFSLRDNTWKQIEGAHFPYQNVTNDHSKQGVLFNGAIHWLAFRCDLNVHVIVAFDLMERKLFEIPLPDHDFHYQSSYCHLWVFGEFLSIWDADYENYRTKIWVMKEYKVCSSWNKKLVLPRPDIFPIYSTKNYDIIGANFYKLVKYNNKGQLLGYHHYRGKLETFHVVMYTESLLSLPGENDEV
jgi:F-box interacting protein